MGPNNMSRVMNYIEIFLPTFDCFDRAESTWAIWFKEIMKLWTDCQSPTWSKVKIRGFEKWGERVAIFGTIQTSAFLTNPQSMFASVVLDSVLGPQGLALAPNSLIYVILEA